MSRAANQLRIIGGRWRRRRLKFPEVEDLRPTPDRVRETLFNWLAPAIEGARCLDLFAGSGALGIEALSRGAAEVVFVERQYGNVRQLRENLALLEAEGARVEQADVAAWLRGPARPFEIVFIDPPYGRQLLVPVCEALERNGWLVPGARIYLESERSPSNLALPENWRIVREKTAGRVGYRLALRGGRD